MMLTWNAKAAKAAKEYILSLRPLRPLRSIVVSGFKEVPESVSYFVVKLIK